MLSDDAYLDTELNPDPPKTMTEYTSSSNRSASGPDALSAFLLGLICTLQTAGTQRRNET